MAVGVLLVTHGKLGHFLLDTLRDMMGELPAKADVLEVRRVQAHEGLLLREHVDDRPVRLHCSELLGRLDASLDDVRPRAVRLVNHQRRSRPRRPIGGVVAETVLHQRGQRIMRIRHRGVIDARQ